MSDSTAEKRATPKRIKKFRALLAHYGLYALTNIVLLTINFLTTRGNWWFLWVVWGWGVLFAAHAGYFLRGWAGAHLGAFLVGGAGLVTIDLVYSDQRWFFWPLLPWGFLLILHLLLSTILPQRYLAWEATLVRENADRDTGF